MRRIDEVIREIKTSTCHAEIAPGIWVPAQGMPFTYGVLTRGYWKNWLRRSRDAWQVFTGYAEAISWEQGKKH